MAFFELNSSFSSSSTPSDQDQSRALVEAAKKMLSESKGESPAEKPIIFAIDDNAAQHGVLNSMLEDEFHLISCTDVNQIYEVYAANVHQIMAVILDIRLGVDKNGNEIKGYQVFSELKKINPAIPIIFRTGFQEEFEHELEVYKTYRPHGYIVKNSPDERTIVLDTVKSAVQSYLYFQNDQRSKNLQILFRGVRGWIHDFGNLFMTVHSREYMISTKPEHFSKEDIVILIQENQKFMEMLNGLQSTMRDYAHGGAVRTEVRPMDIQKEFRDYVNLLRVAYPKLQISTQIQFNGIHKSNKIVLFSQILLNMAKNAYQAGASSISLSCFTYTDYQSQPDFGPFDGAQADGMVLVFSDNAGGIPKEYEDLFFEVDFTFNKPDGSGLGTWLIREGVESRLKGAIRYDNKIGDGLYYTIYLPPIESDTLTNAFNL